MTHRSFRFEQVSVEDRFNVDFEFSDDDYGSAMRCWRLAFDRETGKVCGNLALAEDDTSSFDDWRDLTPMEIETLWSLVPSVLKLQYCLFRK